MNMTLKRAKLMSFGMCVCFLLIHFLMISIFYQCGVTPMVKFNIFSICFYIFMIFAVYKEWLLFSTISIYLEVGLHMTLAIIFTGWNSGFQITLIGMNVLAFYAEYTGRRLRMKHFRMIPICIIGMCLYLGSYIYLNHHPAPYELPARAEFWLSLLWGFTTFSINIFFIQFLVIIATSSEEELAYQLSHDKLTGLPNRYYLSEQLESFKKEHNNYWLSLSDIDDFKKINDTYGHDCGDYVLKTIGDLLAAKDVLCCRWGGEEFLFVGKLDKDRPEPHAFLEEIRKEIQNYSFEYENTRFSVTMTFGLSFFSNGEDIDNVLKDADDKLYQGKQSGKNKVVN